jgi:hypothetical protein
MGRSNACHNDREAAPDEDNLPYRVAMHEAGHAVAMVVVGFDVISVDIRPRRILGAFLDRGATAMRVVNAEQLIGGKKGC